MESRSSKSNRNMTILEIKKIMKSSFEDIPSFDYTFGTSLKECELIVQKSKQRLDLFSVNEIEFLSLILLERNAYKVLQSCILSSSENAFIKIWEENMDSLLSKIPVTHRKTIYRNDQYCDITYLKSLYENQKAYKVNHYLTCSKDFLPIGRCKIKFMIHPLREGTKAHSVYMLYNFGRNREGCKPEWQIEYEKGTEFKISSINQKGGYYVVHLNEI